MVFEIDSRTVMPTTLTEGTPVRVEFHLMQNGMHHAGRITPLASGSKDLEHLEALRAAAVEEDRDAQGRWGSEETYARAVTPTGGADGSTASDAGRTNGADTDRVAGDGSSNGRTDDMAARTNGTDGDDEALPQTASELPWLAALGVTALAVAGALHLRRRRRA
jgi:LPXTG-motif cell wall-anchored protein